MNQQRFSHRKVRVHTTDEATVPTLTAELNTEPVAADTGSFAERDVALVLGQSVASVQGVIPSPQTYVNGALGGSLLDGESGVWMTPMGAAALGQGASDVVHAASVDDTLVSVGSVDVNSLPDLDAERITSVAEVEPEAPLVFEGAPDSVATEDISNCEIASSASYQVSGSEDQAYVFTRDDVDAVSSQTNINLVSHITVNSLPANGALQLQDGGAWRAVVAGERISASDIRSGNLRFVPGANESGSAAYNTPGQGNMQDLYAELDLTVSSINPGVNEAPLTLQVSIAPTIDNTQTVVGSVDRVGTVPGLAVGDWARYTFTLSGSVGDTDGSERSRIEVTPISTQTKFALLQGGKFTMISPDANGKIWLEAGQQLMVREYSMGNITGSAIDFKLVGEEVNARSQVLLTKDLSASTHLQAEAPVSWQASGTEDTPYVFGVGDLNGMATNTGIGLISHVLVNSLPADGVLQALGANNQWAAVTVGQRIDAQDIRTGKLRFVPDANESGSVAYNTPGRGNMQDIYAKLDLTVSGISPGVNEAPLTLQVSIAPVIDNTQTVVGSVDRVGTVPSLAVGDWARYTFTLSGSVGDTDGSERSRIEVTPTSTQTQFALLQGGNYTAVSPDANGKIWLEAGQQLMVREYSMGNITGSAIDFKLVGEEVNARSQVLLTKDLSASNHLQALASVFWQASGTEDTPYVFGVGDLNGMATNSGIGQISHVLVNSLPADGVLQALGANYQWAAVTVGQRIDAQDIQAGKLRFVPDANESGSAAYKTPGVGNMKNIYADLGLRVVGADDSSSMTNVTVQMSVNPVVDNVLDVRVDAITLGVIDPLQTGVVTRWHRWSFDDATSARVDTDGSEVEMVAFRVLTAHPGSPILLINGNYIPNVTANITVLTPDSQGWVWVHPWADVAINAFNGFWGTTEIEYRGVFREVNALGEVIAERTTETVRKLYENSSPVVLDLDGNGVQTSTLDEGVRFDLNGDGHAGQVAWTDGKDGLLALDRNGDGQITSGAELFGDYTLMSNGQRASDGFAALAELDDNGDGVIDAQDVVYSQLFLWVDANRDGVSGADELFGLLELGVASINLNAVATPERVENGNIYGLTSSFTRTDGSVSEAIDVWFHVSQDEAEATRKMANMVI